MFEKRNADGPKAESAARPASAPSRSSEFNAITQSNGPKASIGSAIRISGDITGEEDLAIDGTVEGTINLPGHAVVIGKSGIVNANISAAKVRIEGRVKGDIVGAEKVILTANGMTRGNIKAPRVNLEDGAQFKGSIDMDPAGGPAGKSAAAAKTPNPAANQPTLSPKREANPAPASKTSLG